MKKLNFLLILLLLVFVIFQSCDKNEFINSENDVIVESISDNKKDFQVTEQTIYYIDNIETNIEDLAEYAKKNEAPFVIQTDSLINGKEFVIIYIYTTEVGYIKYGEKHNINLKKQQLFVKLMKEYTKKTNALAKFDKIEGVSEAYKKYETDLYNKIFEPDYSKSATYAMCAGLNGTGNSMWLHSVWSYIPLVNNDIQSTICKLGWHYTVTYFDKGFYHGTMYTIHGNKKFSDYKTVNTDYYFWDRASSVINVL